jgi:hypothetical protein
MLESEIVCLFVCKKKVIKRVWKEGDKQKEIERKKKRERDNKKRERETIKKERERQ